MVCEMPKAKHCGRGASGQLAMTDGASLLTGDVFGFHAAALHSLDRGSHILDV